MVKKTLLKVPVLFFCIVIILLIHDFTVYNKTIIFDESDAFIEIFLYDYKHNAYYIALDNYGNTISISGKMDDSFYDVINKRPLNHSFITHIEEDRISKIKWSDFQLIKYNLVTIEKEYVSTNLIEDLSPANYVTDHFRINVIKTNRYYDIERKFFNVMIENDNSSDYKAALKLENTIFENTCMSSKDIEYYTWISQCADR